MKVYVIPTTDKPYVTEIDDSIPGEHNTLEELQHLVTGYIEPCAPIQLKEVGIELLANEEGLLRGLVPNENLFPFFYVGPLVAVGVGDEDFVSLTPEQLTYLKAWLEHLTKLT